MARVQETTTLFGNDAVAPQPAGYALVALERGIDTHTGGLTYAIPASLADLAVGERVIVPLGRGDKAATGYVIDRLAASDVSTPRRGRIKAVISRDAGSISLPEDLVALARWIAGYYCCPLGMVFATMLPAAVKKGTGVTIQTQVSLADPVGPGLPGQDGYPIVGGCPGRPGPTDASDDAPHTPKITPLQRQVLDAMQSALQTDEQWLEIKELADRAGAKSISPVRQLLDKGLLASRRVEQVVSTLDLRAQQQAAATPRLTLNKSQQSAVDYLTRKLDTGFGVHLLHGVTGSGKTEVYLRLIEAVRSRAGREGDAARHPLNGEAGRPGVIVLVPEIALTPQTVARFLARFDDVAVLHSGLTAAQRHAQWRRIRQGEASIVIGARSAVFAPVARLGLIVVDEEQEQSYKQDQLPRYHARDVAIKRGQIGNFPVVLGSATPSLETYYNAGGGRTATDSFSGRREASLESPSEDPLPSPQPSPGESGGRGGKAGGNPHYHLICLPERVPGMALPKVEIVDMVEDRRQRRGVHLISQRLESALKHLLSGRMEAGKGQAMLLLNRRGYGNYIACPDHRCGWTMRCAHCDAAMVYHKDGALPAGGVVQCHHCTAEVELIKFCPLCGKRVTVFGLGTQRVEEELSRKLPHATALLMDSDTMRHAGDYQDALDRFGRGEVDVLLGTQMIAKGLDFPNVRLVGVISGDTSLHLPDFRAAERTFQLIAQVAGRAGRSEHPGRVIVQTYSAGDATIELAAAHDYEKFAQKELALRREMGLPPITRMARIVVRDKDHAACVKRAGEVAAALVEQNAALAGRVRIRGPMPCPISRLADYHRQEIELIADPPGAAGALQQLLTAMRRRRLLVADSRTAVDVDPVVMV